MMVYAETATKLNQNLAPQLQLFITLTQLIKIILAAKKPAFAYYRRFLAHSMLKTIHQTYQSTLPTQVIAVPNHKLRFLQNPTHLSEELADICAKALKLPLIFAQKTRFTPKQSHLKRSQRKHNLKNAFIINKKVDEHIAIIDDVFTTGTTVNTMSLLLRKTWGKAY